METEITLIKVETSLIISPMDNINLRTKKVVDQELLEEVIVNNKSDLNVFNLKTQELEIIKLSELNTDHHWYYRNDKLFKIIHTLKDYE